MTRRGAAALLLSLAPMVAAARYGWLFWPSVAVTLGVVAMVVIDWRRAPSGTRLRATRECPEVLEQGRPNLVRLSVAVEKARRAVHALVRDEHPADVPASVEVQPTLLPAQLEYTLTPLARGRRAFGHTVVRVEGPLRLATRQSTAGAAQVVSIDPDLSAVRAWEALVRRGQLAEMGVRVLRRPGEGTEFERVRDAVPDDPLRSINWKATARTGRLMTTELAPEKAQPVIVCLDCGRLMGVAAGALTKLDHAITAALLLVHVALRSGDRAGLLAFADSVTVALRPRAGRTQMAAFVRAVRPLQPSAIEPDYDEAFAHLSRWQSRRALIAVFTDVIDPDQSQALITQCARLRRRHLPLVVTVRDPALDDVARRRPGDAEQAYARAVAASLLSDRADTLRLLRRSGVETIDADARSLSPRLLNRYLELKRSARL